MSKFAAAAAEALLAAGLFAPSFELAAGRFGRRRAEKLRDEALAAALAEFLQRRRPRPVDEEEADALFWQRAWEPVLSSGGRRDALRLLQSVTDASVARRSADAELARRLDRSLDGDDWLPLSCEAWEVLRRRGCVRMGMRLLHDTRLLSALVAEAADVRRLPRSRVPEEARRALEALTRGCSVRAVPSEPGAFVWPPRARGSGRGRWRAGGGVDSGQQAFVFGLCFLGGRGPALELVIESHERAKEEGGGDESFAGPGVERFWPQEGDLFLLDSRLLYRFVDEGAGALLGASACVTFAFKDA